MIYYFTEYTRLILCFGLSLFITFVIIPSIVDIARIKSLVAIPNDRTSHKHEVPVLGGLGIFIGFIISCLIFLSFSSFPRFQYLFAALILIFFIGFKDDVIGISPMKKFLGQVIAALIIFEFGEMHITDLHGFLGIHHLNYTASLILTLVTIVGVTNCFNLMDGIDGLSASLGILSAATFGWWFFKFGQYDWTVLSAGLIGALLAFFYFNVFGRKYKIFMGDTGSLLLGYLMSVMAIEFNEFNISLSGPLAMPSTPAIAVGILIIPVFDTLRVSLTRLLKRKSPFLPDKTHIHHHLLCLGFSHIAATTILFITGLCFVVVSFLLRDLNAALLLLILLSLAAILSFFTIFLANKKSGSLPDNC
jgi:UDP-GlcNAc:undecaprenyl-phosphate/decaprenyl-phosphate GlcNAc-1-phosphate transferase